MIRKAEGSLAPRKALAEGAALSSRGNKAPSFDRSGATEPAAVASEALSEAERDELHANEQKISRGAAAWLEMGEALNAIREKRLYRETHSTLDDYLWDTFRLERSTAYQLMSGARRYQAALPTAKKLGIRFTNESQLRALSGCQNVQLPEVLKLAAKRIEPDADGNRFPTAKILTAAVQEVKGKSPAAAAPVGKPSDKFAAEVASKFPRVLTAWEDSVLLTAAGQMAKQLAARGLIAPIGNAKVLDAPKEPHKPAPVRRRPEPGEFVEYFK